MRLSPATKLLLVTCIAGHVSASSAPAKFGKNLAVLSAPGQNTADRSQLLQAYYDCAVELGVQDRPMPRVVIISAGPEESRIADVRGWGHIFVERHPEMGNTVYMAWVVGSPRDTDVIDIFVNVLNTEFDIGLREDQIKTTIKHVYAERGATVSADFLRKAGH